MIRTYQISLLCLALSATFFNTARASASDQSPCAASAPEQPPTPAPLLPLDFSRINQAMLQTDPAQRIAHISLLLGELDNHQDALTSEISSRLRLSLAQALVQKSDLKKAKSVLREVSLDSIFSDKAIFMMAEIEAANGNLKEATQWMLRLSRQFPEQPNSVRGLLKAANWQSDDAMTLALLNEANRISDQTLQQITVLEKQLQSPDFFNSESLEKPSPLLYQLTRKALLDSSFKIAREEQKEALAQLSCMSNYLEKQSDLLSEKRNLIAELGGPTQRLVSELEIAKLAMPEREKIFLAKASELKTCKKDGKNCQDLENRYNALGKQLTGWRNRIRVLEQKSAFLHDQRSSLQSRLVAENRRALGLTRLLIDKKAKATAVLNPLLQQAVSEAAAEWKEVATMSHEQLGIQHEILSTKEMPSW